MKRPFAIKYATPVNPNLLPGFSVLNLLAAGNTISGTAPIEVAETTNVVTPGSGVWELVPAEQEVSIDFTFGISSGGELAFKQIITGGLMYFTMGVLYSGSFKLAGGTGADPNWYDSNVIGAGDFSFTAANNSFVIIKNNAGTLEFYQTTDNDTSRTPLITSPPVDFTVSSANVIRVKIYSYGGRGNSRVFYPQYKP